MHTSGYGGDLTQSQLLSVIALGIAWIAIIGLGVALAMLIRRHRSLETRYEQLLNGASGEGLADALLRHVDQIQRAARDILELRQQHEDLRAQVSTAVQHVGLVRYNPFGDMGGDYSVALALTDSVGRGIVMSSLHGRTATRLYVRSLQDWDSANPLSAEEQEAVRIAREGPGSANGVS